MIKATIVVRDEGVHFAHVCLVVSESGETVHTTRPVPYGMQVV